MESSGTSVGRATLLIVVSALSFGSISVLTVLTTNAGVPLLTAMAWRYVVGAVLLGVVAQVRQIRSLHRQRIVYLMLIGGVGQALITYLSLHALEYIPVGPLAFLFYTYPAWVALLAAVRRTERLTPIRVFALVLALVGVTIMVGTPAEKLNPVGVMLALGSALLYSVYLPALERVHLGGHLRNGARACLALDFPADSWSSNLVCGGCSSGRRAICPKRNGGLVEYFPTGTRVDRDCVLDAHQRSIGARPGQDSDHRNCGAFLYGDSWRAGARQSIRSGNAHWRRLHRRRGAGDRVELHSNHG